MTALDGRGGEVDHHQGIQRLWDPSGYCDLLPIPGTGDLGSRRRLEVVGQDLVPGKFGVEEDSENHQQVRGKATGVRIFL